MPEDKNWRARGDWGSSNGGHRQRGPGMGQGGRHKDNDGCPLLMVPIVGAALIALSVIRRVR